MQCECKIPAGLFRITQHNWSPTIANAITKIIEAVLKVIQSPGFCPVKSGDLRDGHYIQRSGELIAEIKCNVEYWINVIYGHRVVGLQTESQRKAYFAKLASGEAEPPKGVDFVPPDNYIYRAVVEVWRSGIADNILRNSVTSVLGGY